MRAKVLRVAKGTYALDTIYLTTSGGTIGQDCHGVSDSLYVGVGPVGKDYLYLTSPSDLQTPPVPGDSRYRFYSGYSVYPVSPSGTITIGPERDIMDYRADDPPRTITIEEAFREIAALSSPSATPTR